MTEGPSTRLPTPSGVDTYIVTHHPWSFLMRRLRPLSLSFLPVLGAAGCIIEEPPVETPPLFGQVEISVIADREDGLRGPRDLDFNPDVEGELWVINRTDDAAITISNVGTTAQTALRRKDPFALHFMEETSSISFSKGMKFGTCGESRNTYDGQVEGNDFTGPSLWSADPEIFAITNPEAVADNGGSDLGSHLDMMHETPLCMGIAWVSENIYFVYEGLTNTVARYDFKIDHGPGFDDHRDGTVERFVDVDVAYVADVPSHLVYDPESELVYVADTGNNRIGILDASTAQPMSEADTFRGFETLVHEPTGASWSTLIRGGDFDLEAPSGLALKDGILYVGDNGTSRISAFDLEGNLLDTLDLEIEAGGLMGIRVSPDGESLYVTDFEGDRVLRVAGLDR